MKLSSVFVVMGFLVSCEVGHLATKCQAQYQFITIDYPGAAETVVRGLNNHGVVVGEYGNIDFTRAGNGGNFGFVFDGVTYTSLRVPNSFATAATGINDQGIVVGNYLDRSGKEQGFWFDGTTYHTLSLPGAEAMAPEDINNTGVIVGGFSTSKTLETLSSFRCTGDVCETFDFPGGNSTVLTGNNAQGDEVGISVGSDTAVGFLLPEFRDVQYPEAATTRLTGIADNRQVTGVHTTLELTDDFQFLATNHGFLYDPVQQTFLDIELPGVCGYDPFAPNGACQGSLEDVNSAGTLVGFFDQGEGTYHGFIGVQPTLGDFDQNGRIDALDIDLLSLAIQRHTTELKFDLNQDQVVDLADHETWIQQVKRTWVGDANLNGVFDSNDFVEVFQRGEYEDDTEHNSTWAEGDWNGDLEFDASDFVMAFAEGGYEAGPRLAVLVPEPSPTGWEVLVAALPFTWRRRSV